MNHILLTDDSVEIFDLVKKSLGSTVKLEWARNVSEASRWIDRCSFDLILLDVMLPDGDGFRLCSMIRAKEDMESVPIIFLTSRNTITDQVLGFSIGADDYICKPFDITELRARIEARLRRRNFLQAQAKIVRIGEIEINKDTQKVFINDKGEIQEVVLTPLEFKLLLFLAKEIGKVFSREILLRAIWGGNVHVYSRSVDTHISKLRRKLGTKANYIKSVHGTGYHLVSPEPPLPLADFDNLLRNLDFGNLGPVINPGWNT